MPLPREEDLFERALALPAAERPAWVARACADDAALRAQIEALLRAHVEASEFMESPPPDLLAGAPKCEVLAEEKPGDRIGRYRLLQKIGEGGCGIVYMAEQEESVRRRVALKVIKLGMDTKAVIARFEAERQALARMEHPNIARVLDAGATSSGRPFFVMELVRGLRITDYCDQNNLATEQRLDLFTKVCQAIQHAHQKGVIHRDIKPSNILVTLHDGAPVPKVIDFGIAKATQGRLTEHTLFTAFEQFIGTPAYVAPEQAEMSGLDIDTRSDIYSLGVLLYELLTGRTPFDHGELVKSGIDEMRRRIRETEPPRPSHRLRTLNDVDRTTVAKRRGTDGPRLTLRLRGDLDWIVMRCLEKDRSRRYETANALATDVQRHLQNEPVAARPPSTAYLLQKLMRRHRVAFAAGAAMTAMLIVGFAVSTTLYFRERTALERARLAESLAREEKARAEMARAAAEASNIRAQVEATKRVQIAAMMRGSLKDFGEAMSGDPRAFRNYLDKAAARKKEITDQPDVEAGIDDSLAGAYFALGDYAKAEDLFTEAMMLRVRTHGRTAPQVATSLNYLGLVQSAQGRWVEAEKFHREALAMLNDRRDSHPETAAEIAHTHSTLGWVLGQRAKLAEAQQHLRQAIGQQRTLLGSRHPEVAASLVRLGSVLTHEGRVEEAEGVLKEALAINTEAFGEESAEAARTLNFLAVTVALNQRRLPEAIALYRQAFEIRQRLSDPNARRARSAPARSTAALLQTPPATLDSLLSQRDSLAEVEAALKEARVFAETQYAKDGWEIAFYLALTGWVLLQEEKYEEAESVVRECLEIRKRLQPDDWSTHHARHMLGAALAGQNQFAAAEPLLIEGYFGMKAKAASIPSFHVPRLGESAQRIIRFYADLGGRKADMAKWTAEFESLEPDARSGLILPLRSSGR